MKKAKFAMAFHCYQPVDNFGWEFERAYQEAYLPLLNAIEEFPEIKATMHYSGNLLNWLDKEHPSYIEKIGVLAGLGQVELMGGGCFEPVLAMIPEHDRKEQISMNGQVLDRLFGIRPKGVWIAEKVWEPGITDSLISSGAEYTIVDDYHLLRAGVKEEKIYNPCVTRTGGGEMVLFPSLTRLRYSMPFRAPKTTLEYIKKTTEKNDRDVSCFFFADDGEKFGAWPYTNIWVHKKGWLKKFFRLLTENADWLRTATYSDVMSSVTPEEIESVPGSSYAEMMEWSGGDFKNFLKKYPESGRMHGRMISVSEQIQKARSSSDGDGDDAAIKDATKELLKAQSNCAYWHGTFGGLYFPHLRSGVYTHLIKAQKMVDAIKEGKVSRIGAVERDLGGDRRETVLRNASLDVFIKPDEGGAISELDYKPANVNLTNTMSRVREGYHNKLQRRYFGRIRRARKAVLRGEFADVHDVLGVKEKGLKKVLFYDDRQRMSFLTHILRTGEEPWRDMLMGKTGHSRFLTGKYLSEIRSADMSITQALRRRDRIFSENGLPSDLEVLKEITVGPGPEVVFTHRLRRHSGRERPLKYALEFNLLIWDEELMLRPVKTDTDRFKLCDRDSSLSAEFSLDREFQVFTYPIHTVNETEAGLVKTFQGISVLIGDTCEADMDTDRGMRITLRMGK